MLSKVLSTLAVIVFLIVVGLVGEWETHYTRLAICTDINYDINVAEFTDNRGKVWEWEIKPFEHFENGSVYCLHMSNNHSPMFFQDDFIKKISEN